MSAWRPIAGFAYEVSDTGQVRRNGKPRPLRQHPDKDGYLTVILFRDGSRHRRMVSHLVATAFVGPRPPGLVCAHNDGDLANNRAENLKWCTQLENVADKERHGTIAKGERTGHAKLTAQKVRLIRSGYAGRRGEIMTIARRHGISHVAVSALLRNRTWNHVK